jgi:hypothetical protein
VGPISPFLTDQTGPRSRATTDDPERPRRPDGRSPSVPRDHGAAASFRRRRPGPPRGYALSEDRLRARYAARGEPDQAPVLNGHLAQQGTTARTALLGALAGLDLEAHLRAGGLTPGHVAALRARLLDAA